jgi:hypothetical protein
MELTYLDDCSRQSAFSETWENSKVTGLAHSDAGQLSPLLLIDDDRSLASLIAEYCAVGSFSITSALNGEEGIHMARQQYFFLSSSMS